MKPWRKSKTIWFNIASLAVAVSGVGLAYVAQLGLSAAGAMGIAMLFTTAQTIGNLYLRTVTNEAIA